MFYKVQIDIFPSVRRMQVIQSSRLRKKSFCCVALHPRPVEFSLRETAELIQQGESLQRTNKYASFLKIRAPCIMNFLLCRPDSDFFRVYQSSKFIKTI